MLPKKKTAIWTATALIAAGCTQSEFGSFSPYGRPGQVVRPGKSIFQPRVTESPAVNPPQILPATFFAAGQLFESQGQRNRAIIQYRKAVAVNHKYVAAYHRLGLLYSASGERDEALAALQRAVELKPDSAILQNNLGFELMLHERWQDALEHFDLAIEYDSRLVRAFINRGMTLCRLDRMDDALVSFRAVLPEPDAHYNMGLMLRGLRRYEEAARTFARVLDLDPYFTSALWQLKQINRYLEAKVWAPPIFLEPLDRPFPPLVEYPRVDTFAASEIDTYRYNDREGALPLRDWVAAKVRDFELGEFVDGPWFDVGLENLERFVSYTPSPVADRPAFAGFDFRGPPSEYEMADMLSIVQNEIECLEEMEYQRQLAYGSADEAEWVIRSRLANGYINEFDTPVYPSIECPADQFRVSYATWVGTAQDELQNSCASDERMALEWGLPVDAVTVPSMREPRPTLGLKLVPKNGKRDEEGPIYDNKGHQEYEEHLIKERRNRTTPTQRPGRKVAPKLKGKTSSAWTRDANGVRIPRVVTERDGGFEDLLRELSVVENDTQCVEGTETHKSKPVIVNRAQKPVRH
jgi:tetratricopeptide (TPR) repeat protein